MRFRQRAMPVLSPVSTTLGHMLRALHTRHSSSEIASAVPQSLYDLYPAVSPRVEFTHGLHPA